MNTARAMGRALYRIPLIVFVTALEGVVEILSAICAEVWVVLDLDLKEQNRRQRTKTKQRKVADSILRDIESL